MSELLKDQMVALIPSLRGYAMSLTRSEPAADALVEETLKAAWRARADFHRGGDLQAWLLGLMRARHIREVAAVGADENPAAAGPGREWRERYGEMLSALDKLAPPARDALLLVAASGVGYEEAARIFGVSVEAMRSRVKRARSVLANLMDPAPHEGAGG